ncbi:hypothetical protein QP794_24640 [Paenibacillus sp. UMB7766-LJ446]|uniref:hypothetical protein n=1 Tax=Paenibacillus sp. UMB7766-LJ446 TaxID=3046313 RepID=UPI00254E3C53|nr:hypothetical protein [Paenibacillus sp. UMB7766-LJ446]MDK8193280.1 hypothetical protein [Paenibacillus sp. UMB7766-LJ446]
MKKRYLILGLSIAIVVFIVSLIEVRDESIVSIKPEEVVKAEIYNFVLPSNATDLQMINITEKKDIAHVLTKLSEIKPKDKGLSLDGDYSIIFNKNDGSRLVYMYERGLLTTSTGYKGRIISDNIINRLWAGLDYPVQNVTENELPSDMKKKRNE